MAATAYYNGVTTALTIRRPCAWADTIISAATETAMTLDEFRSEYHLLDKVSNGPVETYHAQAAAGAMVMVHFLRGAEAHRQSILQHIERLQPDLRRKVLRTLDIDGATVIVTRFILDMPSFEEWLHQGARVEPEPPVNHEQPVDSPSGFTGMFEAAPPPMAATPSDQIGIDAPAARTPALAEEPVAEEPVAEEPVAEEPVAEEPVAKAPGELTLMFQRLASEPTAQQPEIGLPEWGTAPEPQPPTVEPPLVRRAEAAAPSHAVSTDLDEEAPSGVLDQAVVEPPIPDPSGMEDAAPRPQEPGEFTRLFAVADFGSAANYESPIEAPPAGPAAPTAAEPTAPAPAEPPARVAKRPPAVEDAEWQEPAGRAAPHTEPGEFTRMFRTAAQPLASDPSAPPAFPEAAALQGRDSAAASRPTASEPGAAPAPEIPLASTPPRPPAALPQSFAGSPASPPASTHPPHQAPGPGEFTQMFGSAIHPDGVAGRVPPIPPSSSNEPSGAGWVYDERTAPPPPPRSWSEPSRNDAAPPAAGTGAPGSYTQAFGARIMPPAPPPQSPPAQQPDLSGAGLFGGSPAGGSGGAGGDDYFARLAGSSTPSRMPPVTPLAQPPAGGPLPDAGPSEFTRMISAMPSAPSHPTPPPAATVRPPDAPPAGAGGDRWLIMGMVGVLVVAVLFVLLFVLLGG
jgi:hypothetical protein